MKIENCLICCCHKDNKTITKCSSKRHIFNITEKQAEKYNWTIKYIKEELETGRHICACLGSAGLTFISDIEMFKNYCYSQDRYLYNILDKIK
jgi:ribosomal protein L24E